MKFGRKPGTQDDDGTVTVAEEIREGQHESGRAVSPNVVNTLATAANPDTARPIRFMSAGLTSRSATSPAISAA